MNTENRAAEKEEEDTFDQTGHGMFLLRGSKTVLTQTFFSVPRPPNRFLER